MPTVRSIALSDGTKLPYVEHGDPSGVPVVMLHGLSDSWRSFEGLLPHVPESLHVHAVTMRGHGDADRPATGYRPRDVAADVASLVETLGLDRPVVVGHSMGSAHAQRFAIDQPHRLRALVLVGAFGPLRNAVLREFWETSISRLTDPIDPAFARDFQESTLARPVPPSFVDAMTAESLKVPARVWRAALEGLIEDDFGDGLGRIQAPTLIIWGDRDTFCSRRDQDALLAAIGTSRLVVYEGTGHAVHWEEPARFAMDLAAFVGSAGEATMPGRAR